MKPTRAVAVTGTNGLVGRALRSAFEHDGVRVVRLVRDRKAAEQSDAVYWDPARGEIDAAGLEDIDVVFHLAAKGIADDRWNSAVKKQIVESRVSGTRLLSEAITGLERKPRAFVSASATGFYGDRGAEPLDEDSPRGEGFLADTCIEWEAACQPAWEAGIRVVQARIGLVLSPDGGALGKMLPVFRRGLGGVIGNGEQFISWIALPDLIRVLRYVGDVEALHGAVNATAPTPVTNREFTKALGAKLGKPTVVPTPAFALKLAMGEMAGPLLLEGANVLPKRLLDSGFAFECPTLGEALDCVLG